MMEATDLLVETPGDPDALDATCQSLGAAVVGGGMPEGYARQDGAYIVRVFGDPGFVAFAINSQGYGKVRSGWVRGQLLV